MAQKKSKLTINVPTNNLPKPNDVSTLAIPSVRSNSARRRSNDANVEHVIKIPFHRPAMELKPISHTNDSKVSRDHSNSIDIDSLSVGPDLFERPLSVMKVLDEKILSDLPDVPIGCMSEILLEHLLESPSSSVSNIAYISNDEDKENNVSVSNLPAFSPRSQSISVFRSLSPPKDSVTKKKSLFSDSPLKLKEAKFTFQNKKVDIFQQVSSSTLTSDTLFTALRRKSITKPSPRPSIKSGNLCMVDIKSKPSDSNASIFSILPSQKLSVEPLLNLPVSINNHSKTRLIINLRFILVSCIVVVVVFIGAGKLYFTDSSTGSNIGTELVVYENEAIAPEYYHLKKHQFSYNRDSSIHLSSAKSVDLRIHSNAWYLSNDLDEFTTNTEVTAKSHPSLSHSKLSQEDLWFLNFYY